MNKDINFSNKGKTIKNTFYEVSLLIDQKDPEKNKYTGFFAQNGVRKRNIVSFLDRENEKLAVYFSDKISADILKKKILRLSDSKHFRVSVNKLTGADWLTRWERESKPFKFAGKFRVIPDGVQNKYPNVKNGIIINSALAFGLGQHPTTQAMADFIVSKAKETKSLLDVGMGTGILLITAYKMGLRDLWGIDISANAVKSAKANIRRNRCRSKKLLFGELRTAKIKRTFDFVCANILAKDILKIKKKLISLTNPGGWLAVSGIWKDDYKNFISEFAHKSLLVEKSVFNNGWHSVLLSRSTSDKRENK